MAIRLMLTGAAGTTMLQSYQGSKADERAHAQRWREAVAQQLPALAEIELHSAPADDARAMLDRLHDVVIDTHTRPDGGVELVGLYLRPKGNPRGIPRVLHLGAKLTEAR